LKVFPRFRSAEPYGAGTTSAGGRRGQGGFTLIEIMVVIAIVALLLSGVAVTIGNVTRARLRSAASTTSATIRFAFNQARMNGVYLRMVLDLEQNQIWLESSTDQVSLRRGRSQHTTTKGPEREPTATNKKVPLLPSSSTEEKPEEGGEGTQPLIDTKALVSAYRQDLEPTRRARAYFQPLVGLGSKRIKLPDRVRIDSVLTPRLDEPVTDGRAYIYFFPQGSAEPAIIRVVDQNDSFYSIVVHPLTGRTRVYACYYEAPKGFGLSEDQPRRGKLQDRCE
jgi:general secretion pathway protein H